MRTFARIVVGAACLALWPALASAQTSGIAGQVKDTSGAVLPGVTVEASSPALIEKTRSAVTDSAGQYRIEALRPGTYTVTFTLPGFSVVKRDNVELTSDFTATINADMKVGAIEETITVSAVSPIVDTTNIDHPHGHDARSAGCAADRPQHPGGRHHDSRHDHRPRRRRRAVARRRRFGQPPAVAAPVPRIGRHRADGRRHAPEQLVRERRLQRRLLERGELPGVQLRDRRRLGRNGPGRHARQHGAEGRRQHVPRHAARQLHALGLGVGQLRLAGDRPAVHAVQSDRRHDVQQDEQLPDQRQPAHQELRLQPRRRRSDLQGQGVVLRDVPLPGRQQDGRRQLLRCRSRRRSGTPPIPRRPGIDDGHIRSFAGRVAAQFSQKDKITYYHDEQDKVRGHWGISSTVPPEASAIQATPTSFVSVTKWTRTQSEQAAARRRSRGLRPGVPGELSAGRASRRQPARHDQRQQHRQDRGGVEQPRRPFLEAVHRAVRGQLRHRFAFVALRRDDQPGEMAADAAVHRRRATDQLQRRRAGRPSRCAFRPIARNSIKNDSAIFAQDKWTFKRATVNAGVRWDWFISATDPETLPASTWNSAVSFSAVFRRQEQPERRLHRTGRELEGHQPARRHRLRSVRQRQDRAQGELGALRQRRRAGGGQHHRQQQPRDYRWRRPTRAPGRTSTRTARRTTRTDVSS